MPRQNNVNARKESAAARKRLREERTTEQQIELVLARGWKPNGKEIRRLQHEVTMGKFFNSVD